MNSFLLTDYMKTKKAASIAYIEKNGLIPSHYYLIKKDIYFTEYTTIRKPGIHEYQGFRDVVLKAGSIISVVGNTNTTKLGIPNEENQHYQTINFYGGVNGELTNNPVTYTVQVVSDLRLNLFAKTDRVKELWQASTFDRYGRLERYIVLDFKDGHEVLLNRPTMKMVRVPVKEFNENYGLHTNYGSTSIGYVVAKNGLTALKLTESLEWELGVGLEFLIGETFYLSEELVYEQKRGLKKVVSANEPFILANIEERPPQTIFDEGDLIYNFTFKMEDTFDSTEFTLSLDYGHFESAFHRSIEVCVEGLKDIYRQPLENNVKYVARLGYEKVEHVSPSFVVLTSLENSKIPQRMISIQEFENARIGKFDIQNSVESVDRSDLQENSETREHIFTTIEKENSNWHEEPSLEKTELQHFKLVEQDLNKHLVTSKSPLKIDMNKSSKSLTKRERKEMANKAFKETQSVQKKQLDDSLPNWAKPIFKDMNAYLRKTFSYCHRCTSDTLELLPYYNYYDKTSWECGLFKM